MIAAALDADTVLYTDQQVTVTKTQAVIQGRCCTLCEGMIVKFIDQQSYYIVAVVLLVLGTLALFGGSLFIGVLMIACALILIRRTKGLYAIEIKSSTEQVDQFESDKPKICLTETVRIESNDRDYLYLINKALCVAVNGRC
jgi:hypothetical protein